MGTGGFPLPRVAVPKVRPFTPIRKILHQLQDHHLFQRNQHQFVGSGVPTKSSLGKRMRSKRGSTVPGHSTESGDPTGRHGQPLTPLTIDLIPPSSPSNDTQSPSTTTRYPACVALQTFSPNSDAIIITSLSTIPFCCHEDLLTMTREQIITVAETLNKRLPMARQIHTGEDRQISKIRDEIEVLVGIRPAEPPGAPNGKAPSKDRCDEDPKRDRNRATDEDEDMGPVVAPLDPALFPPIRGSESAITRDWGAEVFASLNRLNTGSNLRIASSFGSGRVDIDMGMWTDTGLDLDLDVSPPTSPLAEARRRRMEFSRSQSYFRHSESSLNLESFLSTRSTAGRGLVSSPPRLEGLKEENEEEEKEERAEPGAVTDTENMMFERAAEMECDSEYEALPPSSSWDMEDIDSDDPFIERPLKKRRTVGDETPNVSVIHLGDDSISVRHSPADKVQHENEIGDAPFISNKSFSSSSLFFGGIRQLRDDSDYSPSPNRIKRVLRLRAKRREEDSITDVGSSASNHAMLGVKGMDSVTASPAPSSPRPVCELLDTAFITKNRPRYRFRRSRSEGIHLGDGASPMGHDSSPSLSPTKLLPKPATNSSGKKVVPKKPFGAGHQSMDLTSPKGRIGTPSTSKLRAKGALSFENSPNPYICVTPRTPFRTWNHYRLSSPFPSMANTTGSSNAKDKKGAIHHVVKPSSSATNEELQ